MVIVIVVIAILLYLIPDGFLVLVKVSLVLAMFVGMFHAIGVVIYNNKDKLNIGVSENAQERQERKQIEVKEEHLNNLSYRLESPFKKRSSCGCSYSCTHLSG